MLSGESQIVSRERVRKQGEVYTAPREVNAMCDLVEPAVSALNSTVLEPACGTGNFLEPILARKLARLSPPRDSAAFMFQICQAAASLYGIDILPDNVDKTRCRLAEHALGFYAANAKKGHYWQDSAKARAFPGALREILRLNILVGDALEMKTATGDWLRFTKWLVAPTGQAFQRVEYEYRRLLGEKTEAGEARQAEFVFEPFVNGSMRDDRQTRERWPIEKLSKSYGALYEHS